MPRTARLKAKQGIGFAVASAIALMGVAAPSVAAVLTDNDEYSLRWDNSFKYSLGARAKDPHGRALLPSSDPRNLVNSNDGNLSFKKGDLVQNRLDWLTELDYTRKGPNDLGFRVSAAAWYDQVYNSSHEAVPAAQYNALSVPGTEFTRTATRMMGQDAQLLDAFVHGRFDVPGGDVTLRLGRHTMLWGESFFLATNGIAYGMAPTDIIKAVSVPQSTTKEISMPVSQLSGIYNPGNGYSLQGYYQLEYRQSRALPPGAFLSGSDVAFQGGESLIPPAGPRTRHRTDLDERASDRHGQWGIALKRSLPDSGTDLGMYYLRFTDKLPQIISSFGRGYFFRYPANIELLGFSASTQVGSSTLAGEVSFRNNMPVISRTQIPNPANPETTYATGRTFHWQVSTGTNFEKSPLWDSASLTAEIGGHRLYSLQQRPDLVDPTRDRTALTTTLSFMPTYFQALPNLNLSVPMGLTYNIRGNSANDNGLGGNNVRRGGSLNIGLSGVYLNEWVGALRYVHFVGKNRLANGTEVANPNIDRNFVTFSVSRTF